MAVKSTHIHAHTNEFYLYITLYCANYIGACIIHKNLTEPAGYIIYKTIAETITYWSIDENDCGFRAIFCHTDVSLKMLNRTDSNLGVCIRNHETGRFHWCLECIDIQRRIPVAPYQCATVWGELLMCVCSLSMQCKRYVHTCGDVARLCVHARITFDACVRTSEHSCEQWRTSLFAPLHRHTEKCIMNDVLYYIVQ